MLDEINKSYWTKVYIAYGANFEEWYDMLDLNSSHPIIKEYYNPKIENTYTLCTMGYVDNERANFTQKFIDEVINVDTKTN